MDNLEPETTYRIILFAVNPKGRSEPTVIDDVSFKGAAKFTGIIRCSCYYRHVAILYCKFPYSSSKGPTSGLEIDVSPVLAGLALTAAILFAFVCCVLLLVYRRNSNKCVQILFAILLPFPPSSHNGWKGTYPYRLYPFYGLLYRQAIIIDTVVVCGSSWNSWRLPEDRLVETAKLFRKFAIE